MESSSAAASSVSADSAVLRGAEVAASSASAASSAATAARQQAGGGSPVATVAAASAAAAVTPCPCLLCSESFNVGDAAGHQFFLRHLLATHHVVIGEVEAVPDLPGYCAHWRARLRGRRPADFMSVIRTNSRPPPPATPERFVPPQETYYLLNRVLPEDDALRRDLGVRAALAAQDRERRDAGARRACLFCSAAFAGDRRLVLEHMFAAHDFNPGKPDNLVFVDDLLAVLRDKLAAFQCLFCERTYKDRPTLKDHVRKKHHRRINPDNKLYDRFYMINYVGGGWKKNKEKGRRAEEEEDDDDDDDDEEEAAAGSFVSAAAGSSTAEQASSSGGGGESLLGAVTCLFCLHGAADLRALGEHTVAVHDGFDLVSALRRLRFYRRVRLVNFLRRRVAARQCALCDAPAFATRDALLRHMAEARHFGVPERRLWWSDVNFLFPTDEEDVLLQQLGELDGDDDDDVGGGDDDDSDCDGDVAVPEDVPPPNADVMELARQFRDENLAAAATEAVAVTTATTTS